MRGRTTQELPEQDNNQYEVCGKTNPTKTRRKDRKAKNAGNNSSHLDASAQPGGASEALQLVINIGSAKSRDHQRADTLGRLFD